MVHVALWLYTRTSTSDFTSSRFFYLSLTRDTTRRRRVSTTALLDLDLGDVPPALPGARHGDVEHAVLHLRGDPLGARVVGEHQAGVVPAGGRPPLAVLLGPAVLPLLAVDDQHAVLHGHAHVLLAQARHLEPQPVPRLVLPHLPRQQPRRRQPLQRPPQRLRHLRQRAPEPCMRGSQSVAGVHGVRVVN